MIHLNVLIVEDDKVIAFDLMRIARAAGFRQVKVAFGEQRAMQIAQREKIDLLVTDINLGKEMSGIKLAERLRQCCRIVCIFATAYRDDRTLRQVSKIEHAGYIVKPFRDEEVEAVLKIAAMRVPPRLKLPEPWHYDETTRTIYKESRALPLTPKETLLLHLLYRADGAVVDYQTIEAVLWPDGAVSDNTRRQLFHRFKKQLDGLPVTIERGEGIRLKAST
jgi:DNA-binding response OmpR family regulator